MVQSITFTEEEKIEILRDIIAIETVDKNELKLAEYLQELFEQYDISSEIIRSDQPSRANLVAEIGTEGPVLGVSGHMDVVSAGQKEAWTHAPYTLTEEDGKLYGRGAADMKSGLAAMVIAMIDIHEQKLLKNGRIRLLATFGEENGAPGSDMFQKQGYLKDVEAIIIGEPTMGIIHPNHKGAMNFIVTSKGKSVHSSKPRGGKNAIVPLMEFAQAVNKYFNEAIENIHFEALDFSHVLESYGGVEGDTEGNAELDALLKQPLLTNTVFHGGDQVNTVPDFAQAVFNVRTVPEFNNDDVKNIFNLVLAQFEDTDAELSIDITLDLDPLNGDPESKLVHLTRELSQPYYNNDILVSPMTGATDGSNFVKNKGSDFPIIIFGPGSERSHQIDEYVEKEDYLNFIELYIELFSTYTNNM